VPGWLIWLAWASALLFAYALGRKDARTGRHHRRGGYIRPSLSASDSANHTTGPTLTLAATSTGCKQAGQPQAEPDSPATLHAPSRTTEPGGFSSVTEIRRGALTTAAAPDSHLRSFVWPDGVTRYYDDAA
jgi:hypothetical protein